MRLLEAFFRIIAAMVMFGMYIILMPAAFLAAAVAIIAVYVIGLFAYSERIVACLMPIHRKD